MPFVPSFPEIAGAGASVEGDRGDLLTPGYPEQNYENGALYQVLLRILYCVHMCQQMHVRISKDHTVIYRQN